MELFTIKIISVGSSNRLVDVIVVVFGVYHKVLLTESLFPGVLSGQRPEDREQLEDQ